MIGDATFAKIPERIYSQHTMFAHFDGNRYDVCRTYEQLSSELT